MTRRRFTERLAFWLLERRGWRVRSSTLTASPRRYRVELERPR